jgi:HAD superfamily hydrolase (TIGR01509 family)
VGSVRWWIRVGLWLAAALAITACDASVDVDARVNEDGSGVVNVAATLDSDVATELLDLRTSGIALTDLNQAGWETSVDTRAENGATVIFASKAFGTPTQFSQVMAELSGESGLFNDFTLERTPGFARVDYAVRGALAPQGFASFSDPELEAALGTTVQAIAVKYGATASDVEVTMSITLPGDVKTEASTGVPLPDSADSGRRWATTAANGQPTEVAVVSSTRHVQSLVLRGIAIIFAGLALLMVFGQLLRVLTPDRRRPTPQRPRARASDAPVQQVEVVVEDTDVSDEPDNPRVVALDGMGVIFKESNDIHNVLVPFAHEIGSPLTSDEIVLKARALSLGRMTTGQFWKAIGIDGTPEELDDAYLSRLSLNPGVVKFLRTLRDRGVRVACITNDSTTWAMKLRQRHSLEGLVDPWVISGQVGVRKPDNPMWEVLRRVTGEPPAAIMVIDDDLDILDSARKLGFRTAWFSPDGEAPLARGHAILRSFDLPAAPETAVTSESV